MLARSPLPIAILAIGAACGDDASVQPDAAPRCLPGEHDEDGDGIVDDCDNCPTITNPTQADTTETAVMAFDDGVGDACDRRPALSGDKIAALHAFGDASESSAWVGTGWAITDDAAHAMGAQRWKAARNATGDGVIVAARITALQWLTSAGDFSIAIDGDGITAGAVCIVTGGKLVALERGGGEMRELAASTAASDNDPLTLVAWRRLTSASNELVCSVEHGSQKTEARITLADDLVTGSHVLATTDASVTLSSVVVYTSPGPKTP